MVLREMSRRSRGPLLRRALSQATQGRGEFCHMAHSLYKMGELRNMAGESPANCYRYFKDVELSQHSRPRVPLSPPVQEFIDISLLITEFGTPEVADQLADAVSKSGAAVEERCVQSLRLAEEDIPKFSISEIDICLQYVSWWPSDVARSQAAVSLLHSLDETCVDKLHARLLSMEEQFRLAFLWQSLVCRPQGTRLTRETLASMSSFILQSPLTGLVSFLLILASLEDPLPKLPKCSEFCDTLQPALKILSESELLAAFLGLCRLDDCSQKDSLRVYLEKRFNSGQP